MDKELENKLIEYHTKKLSYREMARLTGITDKTVGKYIRELKDQGKIEGQTRSREDLAKMEHEVGKMYEMGMSITQIADKINMSKAGVHRICHKLHETEGLHIRTREEGRKIQREQEHTPRPPQHKKVLNLSTKKETKAPEIIVNEQGVRCTCKIAKKCRFGFQSASMENPKCNFLGCTGVPRINISPDISDCHCFQPITKENPRYKTLESFNPSVDRTGEE